jgi:uncharacterized protein YndB with AHSA1/START domain
MAALRAAKCRRRLDFFALLWRYPDAHDAPVPPVRMEMAFEHPRERVFDFLADVRNERSWNPDVVSIEKLSDGPVGPGSSFRGEFRGVGAMTIRITGYERPHRLAIAGEASRLAMDVVYELSGDGRATSVVMVGDVRPKGALRAMAPVVGAVMRRQLAERPAQLRRALDAAAD